MAWFTIKQSGCTGLVAAEQSVQWVVGILPHFQAFFWLWVFSTLEANPCPPTSG
jgi:hypothetical protein